MNRCKIVLVKECPRIMYQQNFNRYISLGIHLPTPCYAINDDLVNGLVTNLEVLEYVDKMKIWIKFQAFAKKSY